MWAVYLIFFGVLTLFFVVDMYAAAIYDMFACRAYDIFPMVNGDKKYHDVNGNWRGIEYRNKNKVLENR